MARKRVRRALTYDQQWTQWQKDIERIYKETVYVFEQRLVFREVTMMFQENDALKADGGFIWDWLRGIYGPAMVIAVGRELDRDTEVVNLIQLMYQMTKRPKVVSRKRFVEMLKFKPPPKKSAWPPSADGHLYELNQNWFTKNIGTGEYLDRATIKKDRNWLEKRCRAVMKYRHKIVAHRTGMELSLTIKQLHDALDAIEKMLKKYYVLFAGSALMQAEPAIQFNWKKPFTIPWIKK
jgi:hypothetical protein